MNLEIKKSIARALAEDCNKQDITTGILVPRNQISEACIIAQEEAVICGLEIIKYIFKKLDPKMHFRFYRKDGGKIRKNGRAVFLKGKTHAILSGERVALNFISYLSGISTQTNRFVEEVKTYKVQVMDTRKTIPGIRALAKMAVRVGGGVNHRFNLKEMVMIKDNHLVAYKKNGCIKEAISKIREKTSKIIIMEVDNLTQFRQTLKACPDIILLDNMSLNQIKKAVALNKKDKNSILLEASGGITLKNIRSIAKTGVDRISVGALTHSPKSIDFSMEFKK